MISYKHASGCFFALLGLLVVSPSSHAQQPQARSQKPMVYEDTAGGVRYLEQGQPPVIIHATVDNMRRFREAHPNAGHAHGGGPPVKTSNELDYHGGTGGVGVETAPKIYLVLWGSQWKNNDPSGEEALLLSFYSDVGGSSWLNSVTQYCEGVASGTVYCAGTGGTPAGNQSGIYSGIWLDDGSAAPSKPKQSQFAAEAVRAAANFGNNSASSNDNAQYVIATAHGYNASGFGRQYCAYHSSTSSSYGNIAYTNLPYITDAGANCGANFNGLGADAGITIVAGHEMAETITDQFPSTGWLDGNGEENGDKCAWISSGQGASATIKISTGTFAVQSLWSNAFNNNSGGCVMSY